MLLDLITISIVLLSAEMQLGACLSLGQVRFLIENKMHQRESHPTNCLENCDFKILVACNFNWIKWDCMRKLQGVGVYWNPVMLGLGVQFYHFNLFMYGNSLIVINEG